MSALVAGRRGARSLNPITIFKDINRRLEVEDHLEGVKEQARADAARFAQAAIQRSGAIEEFELQQMNAAYDAEDRMALEELQQSGLNERKKWDIEAQAAKAAAAAKASGMNTDFDNAKGMADLDSATAYLNTTGRTELVPALAAHFAAQSRTRKRAGFEAALKAAGTQKEFDALMARPEAKEYLESMGPEIDVARTGAQVSDQRWNAQEGRRISASARAAESSRRAGEKGSKPVVLSAAQERALTNNIATVKRSMLTADEEEKGYLQEQLDDLLSIKERSKRSGTGAGSSAFSPEIMNELRGIFKK